jgi:hypothetical protein
MDIQIYGYLAIQEFEYKHIGVFTFSSKVETARLVLRTETKPYL